jgi:hypothetical protein
VHADGPSYRLLDATHQVVPKPLRCVYGENRELVELDAVCQGLLQFPVVAVVLNTLNILPRIFGVHISHDPIPLDFGLVSEQFTKEVISETCKRAFCDLGIDKLYFCSLDFGKSFGFCCVFLPDLSFCKILQGCSRTQSDLGGRFEISLVFFLLHES